MLIALAAGMLAAHAAAQTPAAAPASSQPTKVIGRLGQAVEELRIYASMNTRARVYSRVPAFQHLVVNTTRYDRWVAITMVNGIKGFALSEKVALLPYEVTVPASSRTAGSTTSRSGSRGSRPAVQSGSQEVDQMLQRSFNYIGTRYVWGGNSLTGGIDCSGFVKELYEGIGVNLPRTAREQARVGKPIERLEDLRAGDRLYFWDRRRGYIGHTGIFLGYHPDGGAYFIHSSSNNRGVATDDLRNPKWRNILVGARR